MELENLEIRLTMETEQIQENINKLLPQIEKLMSGIERITGRSMNRAEKNMDIESGASNLSKQFEKLTATVEKSMQNVEEITKRTSETTSKNMSAGFKKARTSVNKDVDAIVNDINAKIGQAKAQQEKLAFLKAKRQGSVQTGDTGSTVKYDDQIAKAQAAMTKYHSSAQSMARAMKEEFAAVPNTLDGITQKMTQNEGQIEALRKKIKTLNAEYTLQKSPVLDKATGKVTGHKDSASSTKTMETVQQQSAKMNKLVADNDRLQRAYAETEDRAKLLRAALGRVNTELGKSSIQTGNASLGVKNVSSRLEKAKSVLSKFGGLFNRTSNNIAHGSRRAGNGVGVIGRSMRGLWSQLLVFGLMYKGIMALGTGLWSAMKSNEQFSSSLNQIKVNLLTAFYPIYQAILPALNALMSALATATGYLASFIAMLFGTTYQAAKQGAQGLYQNVQALNDTGDAAKKNKEKVDKLKRSLMGFDEINRIGLDDASDDSTPDASSNASTTPSVDFGSATADYGVLPWMNKVKAALQDFFQPIKAAWDKYGAKVMQEWKYMLGEVGGLAKAIGASFMEVWTNGTGERFVANLLILFADVLGIIGDIARAFRIAWEDNGRGTALIQSIFNMWNAILELLHIVAQTFRDVWNDGVGVSIATNILEIFTNIHQTIANLADGLKEAWGNNDAGYRIISSILGIINTLLEKINGMTRATRDWAETLDFSPLLNSIAGLLESIEPLVENIGSGIEWFYKNVLLPLAGFTIEYIIPAFLDILAGAIDVLNSVIDALKPLGKWLFDNFLKPIAGWTGGVIVSILGGLADKLKDVSDWIDEHQKTVENIAIVVGSFATAWGLVNLAIGFWNGIAVVATAVTGALATVTGFLASAVAFLTSPIGLVILAIGALIAIGVLLYKNWDSVKEFLKETWVKIKDSFQKGVDFCSGLIDKFKEFGGNIIEGLVEGINSFLSDPIAFIKEHLFDPIVNAVKSLFGIHSPSTIFEGFGGNLIDGLKLGIQNLISGPVDLIGGLWSDIKSKTLEKCQEIKEKAGEKWSLIKDTVSNAVTKTKDWVSEKWSNIKSKTSETFENTRKAATEKWSDLKSKVSTHAENARKAVSEKWSNLQSKTKTAFEDARKIASEKMSNLKNNVAEYADSAKKKAYEKWDNIKNKTQTSFEEARKKTSEKWSDLKDKISTYAENARKIASEKWENIKKKTSESFEDARKNTSEKWENIKKKVSEHAESARKAASEKFESIRSSVGDKAEKAKNLAVGAWKTLDTNTGEYMTDIKKKAGSAFDTCIEKAKNLGKNMGDGLKKGASALKDGAKKLGNGLLEGIEWAINKVVSGANWVLGKLGSDKKFDDWKAPKFATGTGPGGHKGGLAYVGDGGMSELVVLPSGHTFMSPATDTLVNLPAGTEVVSGPKTKSLFGGNIPAFAKGTGGLFSNIADFGKTAFNKVKDWGSDIWDWVKDKASIKKLLMNKIGDSFPVKFKGVQSDVLKGGVSTAIEAAKDFLFKESEEGLPSADGDLGANFGSKFRMTSPYGWRTHPVKGGKEFHKGIDYAAPMGTPMKNQHAGKVTYAGGATGFGRLIKVQISKEIEAWYGHMSEILTKKGAKVAKDQVIGSIGSAGMSSGPHVHYQVMKNGKPVNPDTTSVGGDAKSTLSANVERWRSTISKALAKNNLPTSASYVNAWLRQVQSESGGNEKAVQNGYVDINSITGNLARGLLQVIPTTFSAFKHKGYGDIFKGYHNALAAMNYAKSRYGLQGMLNVIGQGHGYENGGMIDKDGVYRLGEGNKKELVIPLEKRSRALELLEVAKDYLGVDDDFAITMPEVFRETPSTTFTSSSNTRTSNESFGGLNDMNSSLVNAIMMAMQSSQKSDGPIEVTLEVDGSKLGKVAIKEINKTTRKTGVTPIIM